MKPSVNKKIVKLKHCNSKSIVSSSATSIPTFMPASVPSVKVSESLARNDTFEKLAQGKGK